MCFGSIHMSPMVSFRWDEPTITCRSHDKHMRNLVMSFYKKRNKCIDCNKILEENERGAGFHPHRSILLTLKTFFHFLFESTIFCRVQKKHYIKNTPYIYGTLILVMISRSEDAQ